MSWASWESALEDAATNGADKEYAARQKGMDTPMLEARKLGQLIPSSMSNLSLASMVSDVSTSDIETIPVIEEDEREASRRQRTRCCRLQRGPAATLPTQNDFLGTVPRQEKQKKLPRKQGPLPEKLLRQKTTSFSKSGSRLPRKLPLVEAGKSKRIVWCLRGARRPSRVVCQGAHEATENRY